MSVEQEYPIEDQILELLTPRRRDDDNVARPAVEQAVADIRRHGTEERASRTPAEPSEASLANALAMLDEALDRLQFSDTGFWRRFAKFARRDDQAALQEEFTGLINAASAASWRIGKFTLRSTDGERLIINTRMLCAVYAHRLVSKHTTKAPTGTEFGPYQAIASLLFSATSGREVSLKRECDRWGRHIKRERSSRVDPLVAGLEAALMGQLGQTSD